MENSNTTKEAVYEERRLTKLEVSVERLQADVTEIRDNHLAHLYGKVQKMDRKLAMYAGGLAVLTFLAPLLIKMFL